MEINKIEDSLNFELREEREAFIKVNHGLFSGTNCDGEEVMVLCEKGKGMEVKTKHINKPQWYEVVEYDEMGFQESVTYECA